MLAETWQLGGLVVMCVVITIEELRSFCEVVGVIGELVSGWKYKRHGILKSFNKIIKRDKSETCMLIDKEDVCNNARH